MTKGEKISRMRPYDEATETAGMETLAVPMVIKREEYFKESFTVLNNVPADDSAIFGHPGRDKGHFTQIDKREGYLSAHLPDIARALGWPVDPSQLPEIITIYLSRRSYWWTHFPPYNVTAKFLRIDLLSDFIEHINHEPQGMGT